MKQMLSAACLMLLLAGCGPSNASADTQRDHILAVGSSTVYPFTHAIAERFKGKNGSFPAPVIQSTGTGAGLATFCGGIGSEFPDVADASRRMTREEMAKCQANGVTQVTELQIGMDGLAVVQSPAAPEIRLSRAELYEALAATPYGEPNQRKRWKDVNPSLPDIPILFYGPPATSGTRDSLQELIMVGGCQGDARMRAMREQDPAGFDRICKTIRTDGIYQESGEDDSTTATKLVVNPGAVGIFGYSFLENRSGELRAIPIDGVTPSAETIASGRYSGARPLFVYVKPERVNRVPGLRGFVDEYAAAIGPDGYLAERGLVPAPEAVRLQTAQAASRLRPLDPASLR